MTGTEEAVGAGMGLTKRSQLCGELGVHAWVFFQIGNRNTNQLIGQSSCSLSSPGHLSLPRLLLDSDLTSTSLTWWVLGPVAHGETSDFMCDPAIF